MTVGYQSPATAFPTSPNRSPSGSSASAIVLVGIGFQVLGALLLFALVSTYVGWSIFNPYAYNWFVATAVYSVAAGVILLILFAFFFAYLPIQRGNYVSAQTPALVLGVLSILTLNIISGVLFLVGYVKIGDAIREQQRSAAGPGAQPTAVAAGSLVACKGCGRVFPFGAFGFCPNCGQKLGG
ncbi:MAG TPA: hypothetical protein VEH28_04815 [Thermoplasmata archaeon]|nr:hypothetical protein [Thermoplasmata archaeon]